MRPISLDEYLNADNPWTHRLLGTGPFQQSRTRAHLSREWDGDYYQNILNKNQDDPEMLRDPDLNGMTDEIVISIGDQLFCVPQHLFVAMRRHYMTITFQRFLNSPSLCELGAGYGSNLLWLRHCFQHSLYGGEFSDNALELARRLDVNISAFDYYEPESYKIVRPGTTVFTSHSIEQIPDASVVIDGLRTVADRIERVIHFEPVHRERPMNLLGQLRNRYVRLNDYNRNLLSVLQSSPDIRILHLETAVYGINPLNPSSIIVWDFMP